MATSEPTVVEDGGPVDARRTVMEVRDVHVRYQVFEDRRPTLGSFVKSGFKRRVKREVHAVRGVDLTFGAGETVGLIGRNGSGKSTLLRTMAGLLAPSQGEVLAEDQPLLLGVAAALSSEVSGRDNIYRGCTAVGMSRQETTARMDEIVAFAGLEDFIDIPVRAYSSGMRARLQFSIAVTVDPKILLIDEVLGVGDREFRDRSQQRVQELTDHAGLVVLVSHSLGSIRAFCDRAVWLDAGVVKAEGEVEEVIRRYEEDGG